MPLFFEGRNYSIFEWLAYLCHMVCPWLELVGFDPVVDPAQHLLVQVLPRVHPAQVTDKVFAAHALRGAADRPGNRIKKTV